MNRLKKTVCSSRSWLRRWLRTQSQCSLRLRPKKGEWWEALGKLQAQAQQQEMSELAQFLGAVRQLVEGADPARLGAGIPAEFQEAWEVILESSTRITPKKPDATETN